MSPSMKEVQGKTSKQGRTDSLTLQSEEGTSVSYIFSWVFSAVLDQIPQETISPGRDGEGGGRRRKKTAKHPKGTAGKILQIDERDFRTDFLYRVRRFGLYYKVLHLWDLQFGNENEEKHKEKREKERENFAHLFL